MEGLKMEGLKVFCLFGGVISGFMTIALIVICIYRLNFAIELGKEGCFWEKKRLQKETISNFLLLILSVSLLIGCIYTGDTITTKQQTKKCAHLIKVIASVTEATCAGGRHGARCKYAIRINDKEIFFSSDELWVRGEKISICIDKGMMGYTIIPSRECRGYKTHNPAK